MKQDIYCNPLQLSDIGPGICCRLEEPDLSFFTTGKITDFREISDPEMLYYEGVWYMYPSVRQAYVSRDLAHWEYHPLQIAVDLGYAPSVVYCQGRFLLTSSVLMRNPTPAIYEAPTPLGPFTLVGEPRLMDGSPIPDYSDPSLFVDDDGRLYLYFGSSCYAGENGIFGMEMDPANPVKALTEPVKLITNNPENEWEHFGEYNEHVNYGWDEGVSMFKHHGVYYLQYAACATEMRNYSLGCYRSSVSPLGPFTPPETYMARNQHGIVTGSGHGGMVHGPGDTVWQFYTCCLRRLHMYERRIGMDRVDFDAAGNPHVRITATPQSVHDGDCGWVPVSVDKRCSATSFKESNFPIFAVDESTYTWWEAAEDDPAPALTVDLTESFEVQALRIIWTDPELDYRAGKLPEPVKFRVEFLDSKDRIVETIDRSGNETDYNVEFLLTEHPVLARKVRLVILRDKNKYRHGVTNFTVFAPRGGIND